MNRKKQNRMAERRIEPDAPKHHELLSSDSSKSLMDNYFESQKVIQSLTPKADGAATKSFRIPKKQPATLGTERGSNGNDKSPIADDNRIHPTNRSRGRPDWNNSRGNQNRRFDAERRQPTRVTPPKRDSFNRRVERNGVDIDSPIRRNEDEHRSVPDRIRRDEVFDNRRQPNRLEPDFPVKKFNQEPRKRESRFRNDNVVDRIRRDDISAPRRDNRVDSSGGNMGPNDSKRMRLESPRRQESPPPLVQATTIVKKVLTPKNRLYMNKPINIIIEDRAAPDGEISAENVAIFLNEIEEAVTQRIFTNPTYQTKFIGHKHENGVLTMICADEFTSMFLQQKVAEKLSLWPGAKLQWVFGPSTSVFINLVIPHSIGHLSEFRDICKKTDSRMATERWVRVDCEDTDDDTGRMYKLLVDKPSFEIMKQQGSIVRCGDLKINIEVDLSLKFQRKAERRAANRSQNELQ